MDIHVTDFVRSIAGRDCETLYLVFRMDAQYVYLVDGKSKTMLKPKKKNPKHVKRASSCPERLKQALLGGGKVTNSEIRKALAEVEAAGQSQRKPEEVVEFGER